MPSINNQQSTFNNPKILVVDDDRSMRKSLELLLKFKGYRVDCAESAAVALDLMAKGPYDTVISDIVMTGMDGIGLLENILEKYPILPVILISGYASLDTAIKALRLGAFDYLKKPVDSNEILFRVRNALEVKRLRQEKERDRREKEDLLDEVSRQNANLERLVGERTASLKNSQKALAASEKKYSSLVNNSPDIIYVLNPEGYFTFVGGGIEGLLHFTPEELVGKHFSSIILPGDIEKAQCRFNEKRTDERATKGIELQLMTKQGKDKPFDIRALPVELHAFGMYDKSVSKADKTFLGTYGVARDITIRKQAEQDLEDSIGRLRKEHRQRLLLSKQLIELLERERRQWAMDLHDDIGQSLASIKMGAERLLRQVEKGDSASSGEISVLRDRTIKLMESVRDFSHWLRPSTLDKLGLVPTLDQLFDDIKKESGLEVHFFTAKMPQKFDEEKEVACFRIVQEALNNTIKHAEAKKVYVNLINKGKVVSIGVEDEGVGFDPVKVDKKPGGKGRLGILIMEERAVQLGGTFSLESRIGGGTQIFVEIPV